MPAAGLIHQFFTFQICLLCLSSEMECQKSDDQMQPKGQTKPFPCDTGVHPAEVFPSSTKRYPLSHNLENPERKESQRPQSTTECSSTHLITASRAAERNHPCAQAILKTPPERPFKGDALSHGMAPQVLSLLWSPVCCRVLQAPCNTIPRLCSQDTAHHSPKQDLLSDPALNTSTDGDSTALPCDLV